jgi:hypothetical protein
MNKVFQKGYLVEVKTCENDGDNYKTTDIHVDSIEDVRRIHKGLGYFASSSGTEDGTSLGNTCTYDGGYGGDFNSLSVCVAKTGLTEEEIDKLVGNWADGEYWRVFEAVKVYVIPETTMFKQLAI